MGHLQSRLQAFVKLGSFLREFCEYVKNPETTTDAPNTLHKELDAKVSLAGQHNGWFTRENIMYSLNNWGNILTENGLDKWISTYGLKNYDPKNIAIIMAGNIPLVGFHDFLCVLITGNKVIAKLSSNDRILLPFLANYLINVEPSLQDRIEFSEGRLEDFDIVIATGSDNTARYFEYYFGKKPNIIRKNRNSIAVLSGNESRETLQALGEDIFRYYGLGCRSVSKLFVPEDYDFKALFEALYPYRDIINQQKYANNYDYNKAVYLMSEFKILDNGFLMLKEDQSYGSPIATLFYQTYSSLEALKTRIAEDSDKIQCIVAQGFHGDEVQFGKTQEPSLVDYADGIDTVEFLLKT